MKSEFEEVDSRYLDSELELAVAPAHDWSQSLVRVTGESPFESSVAPAGTGTYELEESGAEEPQGFETLVSDEEVGEEWIGAATKYETDEPANDSYSVEEEGDLSAPFEHALREPAPSPMREEVAQPLNLLVVDDNDKPLIEGEYTFYQGDSLSERGQFDLRASGRARFGKIDPSKPFVFEVRDRVCVISGGAFINPDDPKVEYGGTWFDWTLVRDDKNPDKSFWPHYQAEMRAAQAKAAPGGRGVDLFWQHEHITRRPIRIAKPFLTQLSKVRVRAITPQVRVGPFVRYTDHQRAVIWLETITPSMIRIRCRKSGGVAETLHYSSTVRVGGRHFAAVEVDGLEEDTFYQYAFELAPLPGVGPIPVEKDELKAAFPNLTSGTASSLQKQVQKSTLKENDEWLNFRTLRRTYDKELRFATGSCRWFPGDVKEGKNVGPDMFEGLGAWLCQTAKEKWPHFLFFGGDQIYSDEVGDGAANILIRARLASRIPGPTAQGPDGLLVAGAWAGRFADRYLSIDSTAGFASLEEKCKKLALLYKKHGNISMYPGYLKHRKYLLEQENQITKLENEAGRFRPLLVYFRTAAKLAEKSPALARYITLNGRLWNIPFTTHQLPRVDERGSIRPDVEVDWARRFDPPNFVGAPYSSPIRPVGKWENESVVHPSADGGRHAADFAEYSYLYDRAWNTGRNVRVLLANVPTFLMFDDHEITDDWNFDAEWVRMIHNQKDKYQFWPKTITDGLIAYWMYQGWCNKAPSQWPNDPRVRCLTRAQRGGYDALPELRKCIRQACLKQPKDAGAPYQTGTGLEWHYRLPFDPPFLVPDCRSRKYLHPGDDDLTNIDPSVSPRSQTIDTAQLGWMREILVENASRRGTPAWRGGPVVFIAPSTPLLMSNKITNIMLNPETYASAWETTDPIAVVGAAVDSSKITWAKKELVRRFRRSKDLEHMIRDRSWHDLWGLFDAMRKARSPVKTVVLVSGDVHHSYCMTGLLDGGKKERPELLQITASGFKTSIRSDWKTGIAEKQSDETFHVGRYTLSPGFLRKNGTGKPDVVLFENCAALVKVSIGSEVNVRVDYLTGRDPKVDRSTDTHVYQYLSSRG
jgi:hypothetical protein